MDRRVTRGSMLDLMLVEYDEMFVVVVDVVGADANEGQRAVGERRLFKMAMGRWRLAFDGQMWE